MILISVPFPPSINGYWRSVKGRQIISARGRSFRKEGLALLKIQLAAQLDKPLEGSLTVTLNLYPPDRRRRDIDNYNKALFDLFTLARIWQDDCQVKNLTITMHDFDKTRRDYVAAVISENNSKKL